MTAPAVLLLTLYDDDSSPDPLLPVPAVPLLTLDDEDDPLSELLLPAPAVPLLTPAPGLVQAAV